MKHELTTTQAHAAENLIRLRTILKSLDEMNVDPKNTVYGMSSSERVHLKDIVLRALDRVENILGAA